MKKILDVCCGPKGMWFDKKDNRTLFMDKRKQDYIIKPNAAYPKGTLLKITPDIIGDFTKIQFANNSFWHIVFDPPHIVQKKPTGLITKQYGILNENWKEMLRKGFKECFRVLKPNGTLIFKWNECSIPVNEILKLTDQKPLYGHKSGKKMNTHWIAFVKELEDKVYKR
jgi:SAM-dependent methyltransferase